MIFGELGLILRKKMYHYSLPKFLLVNYKSERMKISRFLFACVRLLNVRGPVLAEVPPLPVI